MQSKNKRLPNGTLSSVKNSEHSENYQQSIVSSDKVKQHPTLRYQVNVGSNWIRAERDRVETTYNNNQHCRLMHCAYLIIIIIIIISTFINSARVTQCHNGAGWRQRLSSAHQILCALSTFQNHITLPTAQERCIFWAWWRDWVFADARLCQVEP